MSTSNTAAQSGSSPSPLFADFIGGVITSVPFDEETDAGHCYVIGPPQFRVSATNLVEAQRKISLQAWAESRGKWKRTWVSANMNYPDRNSR